jgi:hypothetical protein
MALPCHRLPPPCGTPVGYDRERMSRCLALLAIATIAAAGCGTYNYNRAALVPHAAPRLHSGAPMTSTGELSVGASSIAHLGEPGLGDPEAGVEIPGTQLHADGRVRLRRSAVSLGFVYENGLDAGAAKLKASQPPVDGGSVTGFGVTLDGSIPTSSPQVHIGLGVELMTWRVPYVEYASCAQGEACFPYAVMTEGTDAVGTAAVSVTPTYAVGRDLHVFGGVTARQHPTLKQKGQETDPLWTTPEVESGAVNFLVSAGVELALAGGAVKVSGVAYYDITPDPAEYRPGLAALLTIPLGRDDRDPPPGAPVPMPAPGPYPGQPGPPYAPPPPPYVPPPAPAPGY